MADIIGVESDLVTKGWTVDSDYVSNKCLTKSRVVGVEGTVSGTYSDNLLVCLKDVNYDPVDWDNMLCFTCEGFPNGVRLLSTGDNNPNVEYAFGGTNTWYPLTTTTYVTIESNGLYLRGINTNGFSTSTSYTKFLFLNLNAVKISGNIMALIDGKGETTTIPNDYCFYSLFISVGATLNVKHILKATTLAPWCYSSMFYNSGIYLDENSDFYLPAAIVEEGSYSGMFTNCSNIMRISNNFIRASKIKTRGCEMMFFGCYNLYTLGSLSLNADISDGYAQYDTMFSGTCITSIPENLLPATVLSKNCYSYMFNGCKITTIPSNLLPATTLAEGCYEYMFSACYYLTTIPYGLLPATVLNSRCYAAMFRHCTSLTSIPSNLLPTCALVYEGCYNQMFSYCTSLTSLPSGLLPATSLSDGCYAAMFAYCTSLTTIPLTLLPATYLAWYCYMAMFQYCTSLKYVPKDLLPSPNMTNRCYQFMFEGCSSLVSAPKLPATILGPYYHMYDLMFNGCTSLKYINSLQLFAPDSSTSLYWVMSVASSGTFVKNPNATWENTYGESAIPTGWTVTTVDPGGDFGDSGSSGDSGGGDSGGGSSSNREFGEFHSDGWLESGVSDLYGNTCDIILDGYKTFRSPTIYDNQFTTIIFVINGIPDFELFINSYAESSYDFTIAWDLDVAAPTSFPSTSDSGVKASTCGNQADPRNGIYNFTKVSYPNDGGYHKICVTYRKDGMVAAGDDKACVAVSRSMYDTYSIPD